ncbi:hypothetical protein Tco_0913018 [Tanacetum coccineum]
MFSATCSMIVLEVSVGMLVRLVVVSCSWDTCVWGGAGSGSAVGVNTVYRMKAGRFAVLQISKWNWNVWVVPSNSLRDGGSWVSGDLNAVARRVPLTSDFHENVPEEVDKLKDVGGLPDTIHGNIVHRSPKNHAEAPLLIGHRIDGHRVIPMQRDKLKTRGS